ncbi:inactive protein kinase SELMODRAFT_444075-like [Triticum dicoccoides]|uniref:inactive protein kinase SELMODRAFT_444075-like n=1 Tax=Triticum dicoccoides TaxID=85692 RepID=UPI0018918C3A|nr:inactive protein kinase SELMODRAFT_444075-like [Triticum dicoccoides]
MQDRCSSHGTDHSICLCGYKRSTSASQAFIAYIGVPTCSYTVAMKTLPTDYEESILESLTGNNRIMVWASRRRQEEDKQYIVHVQRVRGIGPPASLVVKKFENMNPALQLDDNVMNRCNSEMTLLATICHDNIIKVLGVIERDEALMLVYKFENFKAVIASFGAAQMNMAGLDQPLPIADLPLGNFGYAAPEYGTGATTEKVDIYSYGVLLLELITGRIASEAGVDGHLANWARKYFTELMANQQEAFQNAVDRDIPDQARYMEEMATMFRLGVNCTAVDPQQRPSMRMALKRLRRSHGRGPFRGLLTCYLLFTFYIYVPSAD